MDCGGKRSATPLWEYAEHIGMTVTFPRAKKRRRRYRSAGAVHKSPDCSVYSQKSYLARLNYTHQNAVKHRLVGVASEYPWCSARWFERTARPAQVNTIYGMKIDRLSVPDEFEASPDW